MSARTKTTWPGLVLGELITAIARTLGEPLAPFLTLMEETSLLVNSATPRLPGAMVETKVGVAGLERSTTCTPVLELAKARFETGSYAGISAPARTMLLSTLPERTPVGLIDKSLPLSVTVALVPAAITFEALDVAVPKWLVTATV